MKVSRLIIPEVVQTSAMDCGPASLKALLGGFGIQTHYGRLREACQTDVDGTSITTIDQVANQLGLHTDEIMLPADYLWLPAANALPAIAVVRQATGATHFVVVWSRWGPFVQVMDPAMGRIWMARQRFSRQLYHHRQVVSAQAWREWAGGDENAQCLRAWLEDLGVAGGHQAELLRSALEDPGWRALAALEAATRLTASVVRAGGLRRGREARAALQHVLRSSATAIPPPCWSVKPDEEEQNLLLDGVVLVRALGCRSAEQIPAPTDSPALVAAIKEPTEKPTSEIFRLMRADGLASPVALVTVTAVAAAALLLEAVLLSGLLAMGRELGLGSLRMGAIGALVLFCAAVLLLELPAAHIVLAMGRALEARLRVRFLRKIPLLGEPYFASRLVSDMAERSHSLHTIRQIPRLGGGFLHASLQLLMTIIGIAWLDPSCAPWALLAAAVAIGLPLLIQPVLAEQDLRVRTHWGGLSSYYLGALLGAIPIRTHGAQATLQAEHERLNVEWCRAGLRLQGSVVGIQGLVTLTGFALAVLTITEHLKNSDEFGGAMLLLAYWALKLPALGQEIAFRARQYPALRNVTLRILEPLGAPEQGYASVQQQATEAEEPSTAVAIDVNGVAVRIGGHPILQDIDLHIPAKQHIAIVGPSGAGKSTLLGLLMGWHKPWRGEVLINQRPLSAERMTWLRQQLAWVDPDVQLWNQSLYKNLRYGSSADPSVSPWKAIQQADLVTVIQNLPDGLATQLGEGGGLISGGEGQRVRLARAFLRPEARLAILDEPFRGLDRGQRAKLLHRARAWWRETTLLCVTHDVDQALDFDRVWVLEEGRIVEQGAPQELAARPDSCFGSMLSTQQALQQTLLSEENWQHWRMENGHLSHVTRC